jgi:hypothetical protein
MKYILNQERFYNVIKQFIKRDLNNYISYDEVIYDLNLSNSDPLIGKFVDVDNGRGIIAILIDNDREDGTNYAIVDTPYYLSIRKMFELPHYKTSDLIADACSDILGFRVSYSIEEKLN